MNNVRLVNVNPRRYDLCNLPLTVISRTRLHFGFYGTAITMLKLRLTVYSSGCKWEKLLLGKFRWGAIRDDVWYRGEQNAVSMQLLSNWESLVKNSHNRIVLSCIGLHEIELLMVSQSKWVRGLNSRKPGIKKWWVLFGSPMFARQNDFFITAKMFFFLERSKLL